MRRRDFLQKSAGALATLSFVSSASRQALGQSPSPTDLLSLSSPSRNRAFAKEFSDTGISILQGLTESHRAQFSILHAEPQIFCRVIDSQGETLTGLRQTDFRESSDNSIKVEKWQIADLHLGEIYQLQIFNGAGEKLDERKFRSFDDKKIGLRIAVASCMEDSPSKLLFQGEMWQALWATEPELLFLIGDSCYTDVDGPATPEILFRRFATSRKLFALYRAKQLIPTLALWDDHDFGANNSGRDYPHKDFSAQNFLGFFAQDPWQVSSGESSLARGPSLSHTLRAGGLRLHMMDCRTNRAPKRASENCVHWGAEQEDWLFAQLETAQPSLILNGSQFFGGYFPATEAFQSNHPDNFESVLARFRKSPSPVVLISGDIHYSEVMRLSPADMGYETLEITSSGMHSFLLPLRGTIGNSRRIAGRNKNNFSLITVQPNSPEKLEVEVTSYGQGGVIWYQHRQVIDRGV